MSARRPYVRPMDGWWGRNPFFVEYMIHEGTAFFVAGYALLLLVSVVKLSQGEAAWNAWLAFLRSPVSVGLNVLFLIGFLYHTWSWFNIMPRTLPPIMVDGKKVAAASITRLGLIAATVACVLVFGITWGITR